VGKAGFLGTWLSVLKEISISCLKFSFLKFSPSSSLKMPENGGKTIGPAG
jgi:hypothetical protein